MSNTNKLPSQYIFKRMSDSNIILLDGHIKAIEDQSLLSGYNLTKRIPCKIMVSSITNRDYVPLFEVSGFEVKDISG